MKMKEIRPREGRSPFPGSASAIQGQVYDLEAILGQVSLGQGVGVGREALMLTTLHLDWCRREMVQAALNDTPVSGPSCLCLGFCR